MKYYHIEYVYEVESGIQTDDSVSYVLFADCTRVAIERMSGLYHEGYVERIISTISEEEFELLKTTRMHEQAYRVTREDTSIVRYLNRRDDKTLDSIFTKEASQSNLILRRGYGIDFYGLKEQIKRGELDPYSHNAKWVKP